jgi:hypothetical protein
VVHVMDDFTLDVVLDTLDTVNDLAWYFEAKEQLVASGRLVHAAGEEEVLAFYLKNTDATGRHAFVFEDDTARVGFREGIWEDFGRRPERLAQIDANQISYAWDALIDEFIKTTFRGNSTFPTTYTVAQTEVVLRLMASETRTERRALAKALLDAMNRGRDVHSFARVVAQRSGSTGPRHSYVFLTLKRPTEGAFEQYIRMRQYFLKAYCMVFRLQEPSARHIVGIATAPMGAPHSGEDLICLDGTLWDDDAQAEAEELKREFKLLTNTRGYGYSDSEYPSLPPPAKLNYAKGRSRNLLCPCGSGRKVKNCEGSEYHAAKM